MKRIFILNFVLFANLICRHSANESTSGSNFPPTSGFKYGDCFVSVVVSFSLRLEFRRGPFLAVAPDFLVVAVLASVFTVSKLSSNDGDTSVFEFDPLLLVLDFVVVGPLTGDFFGLLLVELGDPKDSLTS